MTTLIARFYEGEEAKNLIVEADEMIMELNRYNVIVDPEAEFFIDRFYEGEEAKSLIIEAQELIDLLKTM